MYKTVYPTFAKFAKLSFRKSGKSLQNGSANVGESGESGTFPKKAILAST
jgi:hypothetical protein